jgi:cell division protein FtsA
MFDESSSLIVGLEIGTSKVCAVVGEINAEGALNIIGLGQAPARGVRKGEIVETTAAEESVRQAIVEAEQMANVEICNVYLGITGAHIRGFNNRGVHRVLSADRDITRDDVSDVVKNARTINLPKENSIIHDVRQHFLLDGHEGIVNPEGMVGALLEVDVHVVHGVTNRMQNSVRLVRNLNLEVNEIVFTGLASALAMLTSEQKELGALVLDLGGGTTNYVVYANGVIKHTGVFAIGGDHVSNDLGHGLKVPLSRAEKLKLEFGTALVDEASKGRTITIMNEMNLPVKTLNLEHLQRIMVLRLEELLQIVRQDLEEAGVLHYIQGGVFLCGGGARIPHIARLAETIFEAPVSLGQTNSISGLKSALDQPEFLTAIGLVKYGSMRKPKPVPAGFLPNLRNLFTRFLPQH